MAAGTTVTIDAQIVDRHTVDGHTIEAHTIDMEERLPWILAVPVIGGLSLGLWAVIWQLVRMVIAG